MRRNCCRLFMLSVVMLCGIALVTSGAAHALTWVSEERGSSFLLYEGAEMDCLWKNARMKNAAFLSDTERGFMREADISLRTLMQTVT